MFATHLSKFCPESALYSAHFLLAEVCRHPRHIQRLVVALNRLVRLFFSYVDFQSLKKKELKPTS